MKLNIEYTPKPIVPKIEPKDDYKNPVGVWRVTTEGDCEGRTIKDLGVWEGHIAEIAFHLAEKSGYKIEFRSLKGTRTSGQKVPTKIETNRKHVWISLDIDSGTWSMSPQDRALYIANILDARDQLDVYGVYNGCQYYAGACLVLKN